MIANNHIKNQASLNCTTPKQRSKNSNSVVHSHQCSKHKSQSVFVCVFLTCKKQHRLACNKCAQDHRDHQSCLVSIEHILSRAEQTIGSNAALSSNANMLQQSQSKNSSRDSSSSSSSSFQSSQSYQNKETYKLVKQEENGESSKFCTQFIDEQTTTMLRISAQTKGNQGFSHASANALQFLNMPMQNRSQQELEYGMFAALSNTSMYPTKQQQQQASHQNNQLLSHSKDFEDASSAQTILNQQQQNAAVTSSDAKTQMEQNKMEFFNEIVAQNENLEKVCGFLSNLEHASNQLVRKIDSIRENLLASIDLQVSDITFHSIADALRSNTDVEEKIQNSFAKLAKSVSHFRANTLFLNTTYQSRLDQIEEELDRLLGATLVPKEQCGAAGSTADILDASGQKIIPENESIELWEYYSISPVPELEQAKKLVESHCRYVIEFDGCAKGNPGRASAGFLIRSSVDENAIVISHNLLIGNKTVNQAEYLALVYALHVAHCLGIRHLMILSDSEVIIKQMQKIHQVRSLQLKDYYRLANLMLQYFFSIHFIQIQKKFNARADALAASAL